MKGKAVRALQTELHSKMISVAFFFFLLPALKKYKNARQLSPMQLADSCTGDIPSGRSSECCRPDMLKSSP